MCVNKFSIHVSAEQASFYVIYAKTEGTVAKQKDITSTLLGLYAEFNFIWTKSNVAHVVTWTSVKSTRKVLL